MDAQQQQLLPQVQQSLFEEMLAANMPITESPQDVGFNRNNICLDIRDLGLVSLRGLDALYFLVSGDPEIRDVYDYDLSYVKWLMCYDSNNRKHFRSVFRDAQKGAVEINVIDSKSEADDKYASVPLLGPFGISGGRFVFEVHKVLQAKLKDPKSNFTYLSLRITASFTSLHARVMYDQLLAVAYRGGTDWISLDDVRGWTGTRALLEFKYFKRDVLEPSVKQINELSDLNVRYETKSEKGSKKIAWIRFIVQRKSPAATKKLPTFMALGSGDLYRILRDEFGLSDDDMNEIMEHRTEWTDEWINQAIEFTRHKIKLNKVTRSARGFLMKAIRENWKLSTADREIQAQAEAAAANGQAAERAEQEKREQQAAVDAAHREQVSAEVLEGLRLFDEMSEDMRAQVVAAFARTPQAKVNRKRADIAADAPLTEAIIRTSDALSRALGGYVKLKHGAAVEEMAA